MSVLGTLIRYRAAEHDVSGFVHRELGSFDEVREVRLEESERRMGLRPSPGRDARERRMVPERREERFEERLPVRIVGTPPAPRHRDRGVDADFPSAQERSGQSIEGGGLSDESALVGNGARLVTQPAQLRVAGAADRRIESFLDLHSAERPPEKSAAGAARPHVLDEGAGSGTEEQIFQKGPIRGKRSHSAAGSQGHPRQPDVPAATRDQTDGPVRGRDILQRGAVRDQRPGKVAGDDRPEIAAHDRFRRVREVPRIEPRSELAQPAGRHRARNGGTGSGIRNECLRKRVEGTGHGSFGHLARCGIGMEQLLS